MISPPRGLSRSGRAGGERGMNFRQMAILENIVLYIIVALLFWLTRSPWSFIFLLFVNYRIRGDSHDDRR